ncbi:hypothetical protein BH23GEM3_BH23GEM3_10470 [soil metagenome]
MTCRSAVAVAITAPAGVLAAPVAGQHTGEQRIVHVYSALPEGGSMELRRGTADDHETQDVAAAAGSERAAHAISRVRCDTSKASTAYSPAPRPPGRAGRSR